MKVYPIFLNNLSDYRSIVIGGDHEAERKVGSLLEVDARVTLIDPDPSDQLKRWAKDDAIEWISREYRAGDLEGAFLVIVSEYDPEQSQRIWEEAEERNILINAMDDVPRCNFVAGSVVRRGPLVISISTTGKAPTLSVRMREHLEEEIGPEYEEFLDIMHRLREPMAETYPDFDRRRDLWYRIVDSDVLELIRRDRRRAAFDRIRAIVGDEVVESLTVAP